MRPDTRDTYEARILRVLVHIQTHLDEALDLEPLAALAHFSPFHFHRVFRGMVGEPLMEHVRRLRLERAAHRLKFTLEPVVRIAFEAGYETHEAFTRAFRAHFGEPPSRFREVHQALEYPASPSGVHYAPGEAPRRMAAPTGAKIDVRIEDLGPLRLAFLRHTGPYPAVGETWSRLCSWAWPKGFLGPASMLLGVVHDDPEVTPPERLRYDACLILAVGAEPEAPIGLMTLERGRYAVAVHRGPYERLGETYARLCGLWFPGSGHEPRAAPALEVYRNSPWDTPPDGLITEVYLPLEEDAAAGRVVR